MDQTVIKPTILIVDDEPMNIQVLTSLLESQYRITVATSGKRTLEILQRGKLPDLILLDIMMPEMDGFAVLNEIKKNPEWQQLPVIFVSATDKDLDEQNGLDYGAVDFIRKPIVPAVLKARIKNHLFMAQRLQKLTEENNLLLEELARLKQDMSADL